MATPHDVREASLSGSQEMKEALQDTGAQIPCGGCSKGPCKGGTIGNTLP